MWTKEKGHWQNMPDKESNVITREVSIGMDEIVIPIIKKPKSLRKPSKTKI